MMIIMHCKKYAAKFLSAFFTSSVSGSLFQRSTLMQEDMKPNCIAYIPLVATASSHEWDSWIAMTGTLSV